MGTPTRVAVAGAGYFSRFHYDAWSRMSDVALVAAADRSLGKARELAARHQVPQVYDDVRTMLDESRPDLLDIVTPPATHFELIRLAAERRIDAICQKAFCSSLEEAREATALAEAAGIRVFVHENFRFQPWHREAKRLVTSGRLGEVFQVTFRLRPGDGQGPAAYLDRQPYFQQMPRFLVHETAIHLVDTFRCLFGEVSAVYADLRRLNPVIAGEDAGLIVFEFTSGARGLFDGNRLVDHGARNRRLTMGEMLVEGSAAVLSLDGDGGLWLRDHGRNECERVAFTWTDQGFGGDCVHGLQRAAIDALAGRGPAENLARDYLSNLVVEEAIYRSAANRCRIEVTP